MVKNTTTFVTESTVTGSTGQAEREVLALLAVARETLNPALVLAWELRRAEARQELSLERLVSLQPRLNAALEEGEQMASDIQDTLKALKHSPPLPAKSLLPGF
ncbi:MAG TPA: hypothetical protein VH186_23290 [Chloroflexia bacterium]|nr:hypothetical protein [Chloroflexia bacterium]